jgi:predicted nucleic acid-binding protein
LNFGGRADDVLALARACDFTVLIHPTEPVSLVREDEADTRILECAVAAAADTIVTGDRHLLKLQRFRAIRITTPSEFLGPEGRR